TQIWDRHGWPDEQQMRFNLEETQPAVREMLWAEVIESDGTLRFFGREVRALKNAGDAALQHALSRLGPWYHDVRFRANVSTNPPTRQYMKNRWTFMEPFVPRDLSGKSVLDIGCNSGFFGMEMKKRNADRVVGIDIMPHLL